MRKKKVLGETDVKTFAKKKKERKRKIKKQLYSQIFIKQHAIYFQENDEN